MFKIEEHENQINELSKLLKVEGVDQAKISTILQGLRENYNEVNTSISEKDTKILTFTELNEGLRSANMTLLSKLGTQFSDVGQPGKPQEKKPEEKPQGDNVMSLEDIAKEFLK
jgi:regulator of replication initiation timing